MVGALSAPVHICLVHVHSPYFALALRTWSTADLPGSMTDFSVSDLYCIKQIIVYAASARSNDALWSTWEGCKEGERNRAEPIVLASALRLSTSPSCFCNAVAFSHLIGLQSLCVCERRLHAAAGAEDVDERAAQPVGRSASMVLSIAERQAAAPRTLAAAIQPMPLLLLYGCQSAHHVRGLAAWYASPRPSGRRSNGPAHRGGRWAHWRRLNRCAELSRTRE